jgi:hypothetical protein
MDPIKSAAATNGVQLNFKQRAVIAESLQTLRVSTVSPFRGTRTGAMSLNPLYVAERHAGACTQSKGVMLATEQTRRHIDETAHGTRTRVKRAWCCELVNSRVQVWRRAETTTLSEQPGEVDVSVTCLHEPTSVGTLVRLPNARRATQL